MGSDKLRLGSISKTVRGKYGSMVAGSAHSTADTDLRIPTGSLSLDIGLGGGVRAGRIVCFYGKRSGSKSTTTLRIIALAQSLCRNCYRPAKSIEAVPPSPEVVEEDPEARWSAKGECDCYAEGLYKPVEPTHTDFGERSGSKKHKAKLEEWREELRQNSYSEFVAAYVDMENTFEEGWARRVGIDTRRLELVRPTNAEDAIDIMQAYADTAELDLLAIDSIAHLTPQTELTSSMQDWQQGLQARLVNKMIRKLVSASSGVTNERRKLTQIWINQVRQSIGPFSKHVKPGGMGQEFAIHAEVYFIRSKTKTITDQYGKAKDDSFVIPVEETFWFKISKSKTGSMPWRDYEASYTMALRDTDRYRIGDVLEDEYIFKMALGKLVREEKEGSKRKYVLGDREFTSQKAILEALVEEPELKHDVRATLAKLMGGEHEDDPIIEEEVES